jgi:hypothetical protein
MSIKTIKELRDVNRYAVDGSENSQTCSDGDFVYFVDYQELLQELKFWREEARANQAVIDLPIEECGKKFTALLDILDLARENWLPYWNFAVGK